MHLLTANGNDVHVFIYAYKVEKYYLIKSGHLWIHNSVAKCEEMYLELSTCDPVTQDAC